MACRSRAAHAVLALGSILTMLMMVAMGPPVRAGVSEARAQARTLLAQGNAAAAIDALEPALPGATAADRPELLALLREAYASALQKAEAAGATRDADRYRENLAILDRKPAPSPAPALPAATNPSPSPAPVLTSPPSPPPAVGSPSSSPSSSPGHIALASAPAKPDTQASRPLPLAGAPSPSPSPAVTSSSPDVVVLPLAGPAPDAATPETKAANPSPSPSPAPAPIDPESASTPAPSPAPSSVPVTAEPPDIAAADAAFQAKNYAEAGRIYEALAQDRQLPRERDDARAYCRMVEVVRRINARPASVEEWAGIRAEIDQVRRLAPESYYAEYLRNLAAELSATAPKSNQRAKEGVRLRGGQPDEAHRAPGPGPTDPEVMLVGTVAGGDESTAGWQVLETANFRILHADPGLAAKAADAAERVRDEQTRRWGSPAAGRSWSPRCDVYLYPTPEVFAARTGQPAESPGFSTMGLGGGKVVARRINLRADHPNLLPAILPHEVTHVVLADLFTDMQVPRWADEGMAVLAEPGQEQNLRAADLAAPLGQNRLFRLADLMTMDYPEGKHWSLYYAQSVSLTRYLVSLGTPSQFVAFVKGAQRNGVEPELKRTYQIDGLADLERRWVDHARASVAALSSSTTAESIAADTTQETR
jgi:hypothetical protein